MFRLSDEERLTVRLAATLDGTTGKLPEVNTTLPIDPANGTAVADEHLEFGELHEARHSVRYCQGAIGGTHMNLLVTVADDAALLEDGRGLANL